MKQFARVLVVVFATLLLFAEDLASQRRGGGGFRGGGGGGFRGGGGGGFSARSSARASVSARPSRSFNRPSYGSGSFGNRADRPSRPAARPDRPDRGDINRGNINRGDINRGDINRGDINRGDINRGDINIDRDINIDNDGGWWNNRYDGCCYHRPLAAAAAVGTAAAVGYAAGSYGSVYSTLPGSCIETVVNGTSYWQCGSSWYQPQFYGTDVSYVVVAPPQ